MKQQEELNALKEEVKTLNNKLAELNDEEFEQIAGGADGDKTAGSLYGATARAIKSHNEEEARRLINQFREQYGADNSYKILLHIFVRTFHSRP